MADMSIAHFGTTLIESAPPEGTDQATIPMTGDLARTHEFLTVLGAEIYIRNMYPGVGRQFIVETPTRFVRQGTERQERPLLVERGLQLFFCFI